MFCSGKMIQASFALKILLITIFLMLKVDGNADDTKANPLATITEITVSFKPLLALIQFNCSTRYKVSKSQPISLYIGDKLNLTVDASDHLSHDIENAEPGEYKCKVGSNKFKFHVPHHMNEILHQNITKIVYYANLVTMQTQIKYESSQANSTFQCLQRSIYKGNGFDNTMKVVESKRYDGTLKPKTKTVYRCFINDADEPFKFSVTNNVEDLYPRISAFHIHVMPSAFGHFRLDVSCQTRTANNPKIMLFINHFDLVKGKHGDYASFIINYNATQKDFKCIVENEYGRDVINWHGQNLNQNLNRNDFFKYEVNADKQVTKMIYMSGQPTNLANISCSVNKHDIYNKLAFEETGENKRVFTVPLDKYIRYECKLVNKRKFKSELYTKDWLKQPEIKRVIFLAKPIREENKIYQLNISCQTSVNAPYSPFVISLHDDDKMLKSRKYVWQGVLSILDSSIKVAKLTKSRSIIENEMGYDMVTVHFKPQLPSNIAAELIHMVVTPEEDGISSVFFYSGAGKCKYNEAPETKETYIRVKNKLNHGNYSCTSNIIICESEFCQNETLTIKLTWTRKMMNFFPDGSLKLKDPNDKFLSSFGFL